MPEEPYLRWISFTGEKAQFLNDEESKVPFGFLSSDIQMRYLISLAVDTDHDFFYYLGEETPLSLILGKSLAKLETLVKNRNFFFFIVDTPNFGTSAGDPPAK